MDVCHLLRADDLWVHFFETLEHVDDIPKLKPIQFQVTGLEQRRHELRDFGDNGLFFLEKSNAVFYSLQHVIKMLTI